jgi:hypothetical protein
LQNRSKGQRREPHHADFQNKNRNCNLDHDPRVAMRCGADLFIPQKTILAPHQSIPPSPLSKQGLIDILAFILCGEPRVIVIVVWVQHSTTATRISGVRLDEMQVKGTR